MSEDYTPSMDELQDTWVDSQGPADPRAPRATVEEVEAWQAEFHRAIAAHDAELREQITREIEEYGEKMAVASHDWHNEAARRSAYSNAARIARGEAS